MTDVLSGELGYIFLVSIIDAAVLSWLGLRWYRGFVARLMRSPGVVPTLSPDREDDAPRAGERLKMAVVDPATESPWTAVPVPVEARRLAVAYGIGAVAYASVMTVAWILELGTWKLSTIVSLVWTNAWPVVPVLSVLLTLTTTRTLKLLGAFLLTGWLLVATATFAGSVWSRQFSAAPLTNVFWATAELVVTAYAPIGLLIVIGWRRIRAIAAMTLAATLLFGMTLMGFRWAVVQAFNVPVLGDAILQLALLTSNQIAYYAIYMLLALPVGGLVWLVLRWLANRFAHKAFSDVQLIVDCWFAIVTMEAIATHLAAPLGRTGIGLGVSAFVAYRISVEVALRLMPLRTTADARRSCRLLLLRVFGYQTRTEQLFEHVAQRWRFEGPVQLIGGADLATRTITPADVLAFATGALQSRYVATADEAAARIARLDMQRDPDGRFRVNELNCFEAAWQAALQRLLPVSDTVLMDLRGFTKRSRGCLFELQQIAATIPTDRIVLVYDGATDWPLVEDTLQRAWVSAASPDAATAAPVTAVRVDGTSRRELDAVLRRVGAAVHAFGAHPFMQAGAR